MSSINKVIEQDTAQLLADEQAKQQKKYRQYYHMALSHLGSVTLFAAIYYLLLLDFDNNWFAPSGYTKKYFTNNKMLCSFFLSVNFQTTTAYVDLKCKNMLSRIIITAQICISFLITFYIILTY